MTAPVTITIGGVSWTTIVQDSLEFTAETGMSIPTLSATIYDKNSTHAIPQMAQDVIVTDTATGTRLWGGLLSICTSRTEGISRYHDIQAQGYAILLNKTMCYGSFGPGFTYINNAGQHLIGDVAILGCLFEKSIYGANGSQAIPSEIVVSNVYCQTGINSLSTLNFIFSYLQEAVSLMANYVGFNYTVDPYKNLWYYYLPGFTASYALSSPDNGTTWNGVPVVNYAKLKYKRDFTRAANNFLVIGTAAPSAEQYSILSNSGSATIVSTSIIGQNYPIGAPANQAAISVWVNTGTNATPIWTSKTVGLANINTSGFDCYFDPTNQVINFTVAPPNFVNSVKIGYVFTYAAGQPYPNLSSIATYGRTFSQRLIASDANSAVTMQTLVQHLDKQFSTPLEIIQMSCADSDFPSGSSTRLSVGQYIWFHSNVLNITGQYFIHSIKTKILGGTNRQYDIELRSYTNE